MNKKGVSKNSERHYFKSRLALLSFLLVMQSCCPATERRIPTHFQFWTKYSLGLSGVAARSESNNVSPLAIFKREGYQCFIENGVEVCIAEPGHNFWVDIRNQSGRSVIVDWARAMYVDENGKTHSVYYRRPSDADDTYLRNQLTVRHGETLRQTVAPAEKTYKVREHCFSETEWYEPLLPWDLAARSPAETEAIIDRLKNERVPVRLVVPLNFEDGTRSYSFFFNLEDS